MPTSSEYGVEHSENEVHPSDTIDTSRSDALLSMIAGALRLEQSQKEDSAREPKDPEDIADQLTLRLLMSKTKTEADQLALNAFMDLDKCEQVRVMNGIHFEGEETIRAMAAVHLRLGQKSPRAPKRVKTYRKRETNRLIRKGKISPLRSSITIEEVDGINLNTAQPTIVPLSDLSGTSGSCKLSNSKKVAELRDGLLHRALQRQDEQLDKVIKDMVREQHQKRSADRKRFDLKGYRAKAAIFRWYTANKSHKEKCTLEHRGELSPETELDLDPALPQE